MRSLHGRTAMGQGEMLHPIHAVPAGKPICRRVTRVTSVALALCGSSTITMVRNPRSKCRPRRCALCSAEQRWGQGETPHPIHDNTAGKPMRCRVLRVASVGIGRPCAARKPPAISLMWNPRSKCRPRRCALCSAEQRWGRETHRIDSCRTGR